MYDQYQPIEHSVWEKGKIYYFSVDIQNIAVPYDLSLEIRNNALYPYRNLWIIYQIEQPVGPLDRLAIECTLANQQNRWTGKGITLFHHSIPIKSNYHFPHKGVYTFGFQQNMTDKNLKGIQEIGFCVIPLHQK